MTHLAPVSVRVSQHERELLEEAAAQSKTNLSDFIRRKAVEAAEIEVLERRVVTIPAARWKKFEAWVNGPPKDVPPLRELAETHPAWRS
ncbi:MAG: DUF6290 family protein [Nitrococcus sp.]|nr:DUF6290 family protein [Nitrococcus sp.]